MSKWVDVSTILAGIAGLWTISFAWWTYVVTVVQQNRNHFIGLKSIVQGLRSELELMRPWTGADGDGYPPEMRVEDYPQDWWNASRIIWKFRYDTIGSLPASPYLYHLRQIVAPFVRLTYSISRVFQFYDEYRDYVAARPALYDQLEHGYWQGQPGDLTEEQQHFSRNVAGYNRRIHLDAIGGKDSRDETCLYKAYKSASAALDEYDKGLRIQPLPWWFWIVHIVSAATFVSGAYLLYNLLHS